MSDSPPSMNSISSLDCWDYTIELECLAGTEDLQLAAELGKTLLERNKELETSLKQHQNVIEDQTQEIEYLTKQTVALREVNDSRLRIYEQLEVSIQDLERANHRLAVENTNDKKHIKNLTATIESLETKCEELQCNIDELKIELDVCKKKAINSNSQRISSDNRGQVRKARTNDGGRDEVDSSSGSHKEQDRCDGSTKPSEKSQQTQTTPSKQNAVERADEVAFDSNVEQMTQLMSQLRERNAQCTRDCRRIAELEEQLAAMVQQNQELEGHLVNLQCKDADMKSMHEELNTLEEVRQGQLCSKCLRTVDSRDDMSLSLCDDREDDDSSMMEALTSTSQHRSSFSMEVQEVRSLQDLTRREMTMYWMMPASASILSILIDLCLYFKDRYLLPLLYKSFTYPFLILHLLKHDKIHRL